MATYSIDRFTTDTSTGPTHTIYTGATERAMVREAGVFQASSTRSRFGLGRPAAAGVTPTSPVLFLAEDPASPASLVNSALAWATRPTNPTEVLRRWVTPVTVGVGVVFYFSRGILIPVSSQFVLANFQTNAKVLSYFVLDEPPDVGPATAPFRVRHSQKQSFGVAAVHGTRSAWHEHEGIRDPSREAQADSGNRVN